MGPGDGFNTHVTLCLIPGGFVIALAEGSRPTHLAEKVWPDRAGHSGRPCSILWLALWLIPYAGQSAELPAGEIVRRAFAADEQNDKQARNYTFHERSERRSFDKKGRRKSSRSKTHDLTILDGSVYRRLIARNDQALDPKEEKAEQKKLEKSISRMQKETPPQRKKRLAKQERKGKRKTANSSPRSSGLTIFSSWGRIASTGSKPT